MNSQLATAPTQLGKPFYATYYFLTSDLNPSFLRESPHNKERGTKVYDKLVVGKREARDAVTVFTDQASGTKDLIGLLRIEFSAADALIPAGVPVYYVVLGVVVVTGSGSHKILSLDGIPYPGYPTNSG
ncbi:hypothetical protein DEU56DRAFT_904083 [Suillus clintonianus]|uniref:uncharacterized protein n=1 Tax=Suillus clintonianus TaxID=1904413 RepID=UPI001B878BD7|nr:uncharacterized protein DEU56DRAFT_904083 [Suillus clintonianus]KAG2124022.1 hypothetical protein DEU56DRAFT_904083 [Suillus clintonianus]